MSLLYHVNQTNNIEHAPTSLSPPSTNLKDMIIETVTLSQRFIQKSVLIKQKIHNILHSMIYKFMIAHFSNTCLLTTDLYVRWKNLQSLSNVHTLQEAPNLSYYENI